MRLSIRAALAAALTVAGIAAALAQASLPPVALPATLQDLGAASACPYIAPRLGQSVQVGQDHVGPHNVPANAYIWTNPSNSPAGTGQFVPVSYTTAPLNIGPGGAVTDPNLAYVNPGVAYAYYLRQLKVIPDDRPIVLIYAAVGSQQIGDWADGYPTDLWASVAVQVAALNAGATASDGKVLTRAGASPCPIQFLSWNQGQNNSSGAQFTASIAGNVLTVTAVANSVAIKAGDTIDDAGVNLPAGLYIPALTGTGTGGVGTYPVSQSITVASQAMETNYASAAGYGWAFDRVVAKLRALPNWSPTSRMSAAEMGTWAGATGSARNDFFRTVGGGCRYPFLTAVTSAGMANSTDNPGPHPTGAGEDLFGLREAAADREGRAGGQYRCPLYPGFPREIVATGAYTASEDEIRAGVLYTVTGASIALPNPANLTAQRPLLYSAAGASVTASGPLYCENRSGAQSSCNLLAGLTYEAIPRDGLSWAIQATTVRTGQQRRCYPGAAYTASQTMLNAYLNTCTYTFYNASTLTPLVLTATPTFGNDWIVIAEGVGVTRVTLAAGTFDDGTTTLDLQPGQEAWFRARIGNSTVLKISVAYPGLINGLVIPKLSAAPTVAPGAGKAGLAIVPGTNTGTCKLIVSAGTSATALTVVDNIGAGC